MDFGKATELVEISGCQNPEDKIFSSAELRTKQSSNTLILQYYDKKCPKFGEISRYNFTIHSDLCWTPYENEINDTLMMVKAKYIAFCPSLTLTTDNQKVTQLYSRNMLLWLFVILETSELVTLCLGPQDALLDCKVKGRIDTFPLPVGYLQCLLPYYRHWTHITELVSHGTSVVEMHMKINAVRLCCIWFLEATLLSHLED